MRRDKSSGCHCDRPFRLCGMAYFRPVGVKKTQTERQADGEQRTSKRHVGTKQKEGVV